MPNSHAERYRFQCPHCQQQTVEDVWSVVDISERPDLLDQIMSQTLHSVSCSLCGKTAGTVDASLLVYRPQERPTLMFSPAVQAVSKETAEQHFWNLVGKLRSSLGSAWQNQWVESGVMNVGKEFLPDFLKDGEGAEKQTKEFMSFLGQLTEDQRQLFAQVYQHKDNPEELTKLMAKHPGLAAAMNRRNQKEPLSNNLPPSLNTVIQELSQIGENPQDMPRREQLCRQGLDLLPRDRNPELWAKLQSELGKSLLLKLTGNRGQNIEEAISAYLLAIEVLTKEKFPQEWGLVNIALGPAYFERTKGEHTDNIEKAIATIERAFETIRKKDSALLWAMGKGNLSNIYSQRVKGTHSQNAEMAISTANQALEVLKRVHTVHWAKAQNALANAYLNRHEGNRENNVESSIAAALKALEVFTREETPEYWATAQMNLGNAYLVRLKGQKARNVEEAIMAYIRALEFLSQQDSPREWAMVQSNLVIAYGDRIYSDTADNIEAAIQAGKLALKVYTQEDYPRSWALVHKNLSSAYLRRIEGSRAENIEEAIASAQNALGSRSRSLYPDLWASAQFSLANAYGDRIRGDRAQNIEDSITAYLKVLEIYTQEDFPEKWASVHENLAISYKDRIRKTRAESIELALESALLATEVYSQTDYPKSWAGIQHLLCTLYRERVEGDQRENIEKSINAALLALKTFTREDVPREWAAIQNDLGNAYFARIEGSRSQSIEKAIAAYRKALEVRTRKDFPQDWATTQLNLANAYNERLSGDRLKNAEEAIDVNLQALKVFTKEEFPENWASIQSNLISVYRKRIKGDRSQNVEMALESAFRALEIYTIENFPEKYAVVHNNLGNLYRGRPQGKYANNIEAAIDAFENALKVYSRQNFPREWAKAKDNLAGTYAARSKGEHSQNLETAIELFSDALEVKSKQNSPEEWAMSKMNLSTAYSQRVLGDRAENIEAAIAGYTDVFEVYTREEFPEMWALAKNNIGTAYVARSLGDPAENIQIAIEAYSAALDVFKPEMLPQNSRITATFLANLYVTEGRWQDATAAYEIAIEAAEALYRSTIFQSSRAAELSEAADLYRRAAFACAKSGDLQEAARILEQGRARGLRDILERDYTDLNALKQHAPELYQNYKTAADLCRSVEIQERDDKANEYKPKLSELRDQARQAYALLDQAVTEIRQMAGYENFLGLPTFEDIQQAAQDACPLAYLVPTLFGSLALVVTPEDVQAIWLNDLPENRLREILYGPEDDPKMGRWFGAYQNFRKDVKANYVAWCEEISLSTRQLWEPLMEPLVRQLKNAGNSSATLVPSGLLGFLPLHAAWVEDGTCPTGQRYAFDDIHFTYAPNAKSLTTARNTISRARPDSILAIDNPRNDLPNSAQEVDAAVDSFRDRTVLHHEEATVEAVKAQLSKASSPQSFQEKIAHFSCHGTADRGNPLDSGLAMHDGLLTLKDIFDLNLTETGGLRLAVLSACETSIQGVKNADEVISLPTGLLQAGVAAVIASLWSVSDLSTMMLLTRFYDLWRTEDLEISQALRQSQQWIRDTSNSEKIDYFKGFMLTKSAAKMPDSVADHLYKSLSLSDPNARDFAHPFHWAAFSYIGI